MRRCTRGPRPAAGTCSARATSSCSIPIATRRHCSSPGHPSGSCRREGVLVLRIIEPGVATTIQDLGRPGYAHLGIPPAGVVDPALAGLLNRLVGNPADAALVETAGGLTVEAVRPVV